MGQRPFMVYHFIWIYNCINYNIDNWVLHKTSYFKVVISYIVKVERMVLCNSFHSNYLH